MTGAETMPAESLLLALALLNTAGILPALWFCVRFAWKLERRVTMLEMRAGLHRREADTSCM